MRAGGGFGRGRLGLLSAQVRTTGGKYLEAQELRHHPVTSMMNHGQLMTCHRAALRFFVHN